MMTSLVETCGDMNKELEKAFTRPVSGSTPLNAASHDGNSLLHVKFSIAKVEKALCNLKIISAPWSDIHPMVLKECANPLSLPLSGIFQESLKAGCIPKDWHRTKVSLSSRKAAELTH